MLADREEMLIEHAPLEGDLYQNVTAFGKTFELRYGYYEECDRQSPLCDPVPLYPDFRRDPLYTEDGTPFVTAMQDACIHYKGDAPPTEDTACVECRYFRQGSDRFGLCTCETNKQNHHEKEI